MIYFEMIYWLIFFSLSNLPIVSMMRNDFPKWALMEHQNLTGMCVVYKHLIANKNTRLMFLCHIS